MTSRRSPSEAHERRRRDHVAELSIVFAGSPDAAVPSLRALATSDHRIGSVLTREDSEQGRRRVLTPTAVAATAETLGLPVMKANRLAGGATEAIQELRPDLGVIVAYGGLVREPLLSTPRFGWINLHFSLLPRWRGAAPVQRAIIAGDEATGVSVFQLVPELDAGDVFATTRRPIGGNETAGHLLAALADDGAALLSRVIDAIADGTAGATPQTGEVTLAPKLTLDDARIDWSASSTVVHDRIRGVSPEPGAFTFIGGQRMGGQLMAEERIGGQRGEQISGKQIRGEQISGERLKILDAVIARESAPRAPGRLDSDGAIVVIGTGTDPIELLTVQPAGRKPMRASDWWRGRLSSAETVAG